jgi:cyanate permease
MPSTPPSGAGLGWFFRGSRDPPLVAWAVTIDVGEDFAGTVSALMNTFGQTGGALSPVVFGVLVQWTGRWELPLLLASAVLVGSGLL